MNRSMVKLLMDPSSTMPELAELLQKPAWMALAACRGMSTEDFISSRTRPPYGAKAVCSRCSVRSDCLDYAMADESCVGVWGGTSTLERRSMRQGIRPAIAVSGASTGRALDRA
jgi:WhiB family redox-sensing transcriptional regulator